MGVNVLGGGGTALRVYVALGRVGVLEADLKGAKTVDRGRERLLEEVIDRALGEALPQVGSVDQLVGTGGNIETLWDRCPGKGSARAIDMAATPSLFKQLCATSASERRDAYQLRTDRADTIVPS